MQDLYFLIEGYWLLLKKQDYIVNSTDECFLGFETNPLSQFEFTLGYQFHKGYSVTYNTTAMIVGLDNYTKPEFEIANYSEITLVLTKRTTRDFMQTVMIPLMGLCFGLIIVVYAI
jgi:hypothetical protein